MKPRKSDMCITVTSEEKDNWQQVADALGLTRTQYLNDCVAYDLVVRALQPARIRLGQRVFGTAEIAYALDISQNAVRGMAIQYGFAGPRESKQTDKAYTLTQVTKMAEEVGEPFLPPRAAAAVAEEQEQLSV